MNNEHKLNLVKAHITHNLKMCYPSRVGVDRVVAEILEAANITLDKDITVICGLLDSYKEKVDADAIAEDQAMQDAVRSDAEIIRIIKEFYKNDDRPEMRDLIEDAWQMDLTGYEVEEYLDHLQETCPLDKI